MKYFKVDHSAGGFYCRAIDEHDKHIERRMMDGSWGKLPPVYSINYWRSLGYRISEVTEGDADG